MQNLPPGTHQLPAMLSVRLLARADGRELLPARTGEASDSALRERQRSSQPRQRGMAGRGLLRAARRSCPSLLALVRLWPLQTAV